MGLYWQRRLCDDEFGIRREKEQRVEVEIPAWNDPEWRSKGGTGQRGGESDREAVRTSKVDVWSAGPAKADREGGVSDKGGFRGGCVGWVVRFYKEGIVGERVKGGNDYERSLVSLCFGKEGNG